MVQVGNGLIRSAFEMGLNVSSCRTVVDEEWKEIRLVKFSWPSILEISNVGSRLRCTFRLMDLDQLKAGNSRIGELS